MHAAAGILLVFWILILVQTLVNLRSISKLRAGQSPSERPLVSIVIPSRNEARILERSVPAFLAQDYGNFEVIVVNDRSTDASGEILRAISDPRLTVIDGSDTPPGWLGKPWALEQGRARARGDLLLFVDADLIYRPETLRAAAAALEAQKSALIMLFPHFEMRTFAERAGMTMLGDCGFSLAPLWLSNRSRSPRLGIGGGAGNLVRRDAFESFEPLKEAVVDDISLAQMVRERGGVTRAVRADDLISVRMYHSARELIDGFTKNLFSAFDRSLTLGASFLLLFLFANLFPWAYALTGDGLAIATVALIVLTRAVLFRSLRYRLDSAIFLHPVTVAFWAYIFLRSMWFTGVRNELRWRGRVYNAAETRFGAER